MDATSFFSTYLYIDHSGMNCECIYTYFFFGPFLLQPMPEAGVGAVSKGVKVEPPSSPTRAGKGVQKAVKVSYLF